MSVSQECPQIYRFGDFEVDLPTHELRRNGARIRLQEQPYQVLRLLLERGGAVVTRDDLRQRIWPSSVFVDFDHGLNNAIARLREALGDAATTPRFIETIPRVGYRFIDIVTVAPAESTGAVSAPPAQGSASPPPASIRWRLGRWLALAAGVATAVLVAIVIIASLSDRRVGRTRPADVTALVPSIAVLPFINMSSDKENDYFADGLTEELVNKLAGIRGLKVVARTSSMRFKGTRESATTIGQALQVNHLLEGSVRRTATHLRITAQLIDARKDEHLWSKTYDRDVGDIFQIQEDIAQTVAAALSVSLLEADESRVRRRGTRDPEAYRLYLIALAHLAGRTPAPDLEVAKRVLDTALERDPKFAAAHAGIARYYLRQARTLTATEESVRLGTAAAERAVELDPASSEAQQARANFQFLRYRMGDDYQAYTAATTNMQRAIELDPTNASAFDDFGKGILWEQPDLASSLFDRELQIDPGCTGAIVSNATLLGSRGQLDAARKRCTELLQRSPDAGSCGMAIGTLETYFGHFDTAVGLLRASATIFRGPARIQLWSVYMSMEDAVGAREWLDFGTNPFEKPLSDAARFAMDGHFEQAFAVLDRGRAAFPQTNLLDLPTAKFALLAGKPQPALAILKHRLPDLASGVEPISARNVLPALDLATALSRTGARVDARVLLKRIAAYLDGPGVLRLPMVTFQRARMHALAGERDATLDALDRAYQEGFRTTWAIDLRPQSMLYIDPIEADPAFDSIRDIPHFKKWLARIRSDNARQIRQTPPMQQPPNGESRPHASARSI